MPAPILTFRDKDTQSVLTSVSYSQSTLGTDLLPVLHGESSDIVYFRIYNNYERASGIGNAINIHLTVFDGAGVTTAFGSVAEQSWLRIFETGAGENSIPPGLYTAWGGSDIAIGGTNTFYPEMGSDGAITNRIRAGVAPTGFGDGVGFIEFGTYLEIPDGVGTTDFSFAISVSYEWVI